MKKIQELRIIDNNSKTIFNQENRYIVPLYQRAYAWEDKEIEQMIDDILDYNGDYYIGSLIVHKNSQNEFEVIDGQQRLTTLYLILSYLGFNIDKAMSFAHRPKSDYTLNNISNIIDKKNVDDDKIELSILNGIRIIKNKLNDTKNREKLKEKLKNVILYRIEVPENTDLNRYFEIMNTRGEQLEQHHILKAKLMNYIEEKEQYIFAKVWDACSDMNGYVQMHFDTKLREGLFGNNWVDEPEIKWGDNYNESDNNNNADTNNIARTIKDIIKLNFKIDNNNTSESGKKDPSHFESIIDFPHFLLHTLRVFVEKNALSDMKLGSLLDDKKLLSDFELILNKSYKEKEAQFSKDFLNQLLKTRLLFDKFIIKRESVKESSNWSLKELQKKTNYSNTNIKDSDNQECLMIQAALRVSYTSPKIMHWITELLKLDNFDNLSKKTEYIAAKATKDNFLEKENAFNLGVGTPHIVFNYLDYLLWKEDKNQDFQFEFRNSVEHFHPQNPNDKSQIWDKNDGDMFGNLCLIQRNTNSQFSNLLPKSKLEGYKQHIDKGSLKLRKMRELTNKNQEWSQKICKEHQDAMIKKLKEAVEYLIKDIVDK